MADAGAAEARGTFGAGLEDDLARAALALARRFAAGATLWCAAPTWPEHARHVAVEFVHPVIIGTRALPAVSVVDPDLVPALRSTAEDLMIERGLLAHKYKTVRDTFPSGRPKPEEASRSALVRSSFVPHFFDNSPRWPWQRSWTFPASLSPTPNTAGYRPCSKRGRDDGDKR